MCGSLSGIDGSQANSCAPTIVASKQTTYGEANHDP